MLYKEIMLDFGDSIDLDHVAYFQYLTHETYTQELWSSPC